MPLTSRINYHINQLTFLLSFITFFTTTTVVKYSKGVNLGALVWRYAPLQFHWKREKVTVDRLRVGDPVDLAEDGCFGALTAPELEHVPPQLNQGDSRGAEDGRGYRH